MVEHFDSSLVAEKILRIDLIPTWGEVCQFVKRLGKNEWVSFCRRYTLYNIENLELVSGLAFVLRELPRPIIEVCAGRGKLSYWLRRFGIDIIATDDYSWRLWGERHGVEKLDVWEALEKYSPRTVLGSWIPANASLGLAILSHPTVEFFIDISEGPEGDTSWMHMFDYDTVREIAKKYGFRVIPLDFLSIWCISQLDEPLDNLLLRKTRVLLFARKEIPNIWIA